MQERDIPLAETADIGIGIGLLTRLPVRIDPERALERGGKAAWSWPLAGALVGLAAGFAGYAGAGLGLTAPFSAGLALAVLVMATGAMHEDGLADSADGLWGGADRAGRLEIMKDSRTGAFGVIALTLSLMLRWAAMTTLIGAGGGLILPLIAVAALSRAPMAALMAALPNARRAGLSDSVGRPPRNTAALGVAVALVIGLITLGWGVIAVAFWIALVSIAVAALAKSRIGGQTGDILGAAQQLAEVTALAALVALAA